MSRALEELGAEPLTAESEERARLMLQTQDFDCVLLDVFLKTGRPEYDGSLALAAMCSARSIPCVVISSLADWRIVEKFEQAGCLDFIEKHHTDDLLDKSRLAHILKTVRKDPDAPWESFGFVGRSNAMRKLWKEIECASLGEESVLILGPTGAGKELVAHAIHHLSARRKREPLVLNCSAIQDSLLESELFGYIKGSFTGATQSFEGWFEAADGTSLILDEVADLSLSAQAKVLRALESGEIQRIGARASKTPDVRLIYATNQNLAALQDQGLLREDFRFRLLNSHHIHVPALKDHKEDIPALLNYFLKSEQPAEISSRAQDKLMAYDWPGNVRELKGLSVHIRTRLISRNSWTIELGDLAGINPERMKDEGGRMNEDLGPAGSRFTWKMVMDALIRNRGQKEETAQDLGVHRKTLFLWRKKAPPEILAELERRGIRW
jgi:DNA-binding NtrC family response regulator